MRRDYILQVPSKPYAQFTIFFFFFQYDLLEGLLKACRPFTMEEIHQGKLLPDFISNGMWCKRGTKGDVLELLT